MLAEWVEARKFSTTRLRPGYDQEEVDVFRTAIRDSFLGVRRPSLRPDEIRYKQFSTTRLRPGYDVEEVDAFLDEAELRLAAQGSDLDTGKAQDGEPELDAGSPPVQDQPATRPAPDSEVGGTVLAEWVEARKFSTTRLRPGYDEEEVDVFLTAIRDSFLGVRRPSLRPDEIRYKQFSTTRLRPGYDVEEVDAFLDEAELRLAAPGSDLDTGKAQDGEPELDADSPPIDADAIRAALRVPLMLLLDGARPSGTSGWVSAVAPVVTQAAAGAGHWAAGRRQRALAAWAGAAGSGLVAWGLGTEAPTRAEVERIRRQQRDLLRKPGTKAPAAAGTQTLTARQPSRYDVAFSVVGMVLGVRSRLRHPRRLTVLAIANEAPNAVFNVLRVARAVQRRRPRTAAGSALVVAGSVARLRAASAEPLR